MKKVKKNKKHYYGILYPTSDDIIFHKIYPVKLVLFNTKKERDSWIDVQKGHTEKISSKNAYRIMNLDYVFIERCFL